jgi:hypothetical protein
MTSATNVTDLEPEKGEGHSPQISQADDFDGFARSGDDLDLSCSGQELWTFSRCRKMRQLARNGVNSLLATF